MSSVAYGAAVDVGNAVEMDKLRINFARDGYTQLIGNDNDLQEIRRSESDSRYLITS